MPPEILGVEHVGVAVEDVAAAVATYRALGFTPESVEDLTSQGLRSHILRNGEVRLELLEAVDPDAALARFLSTHGAGLHHLCLRVRSLANTMAHGLEAGFQYTSAEPSTDRRGRRIFLHPRSTGGVLIGLVEVPEKPPADA